MEVRKISAQMWDIMRQLKEKEELPGLIVALFLDIQGAERRIAVIDATLKELESQGPLVGKKVRALIENPNRVELDISGLKREFEAQRHKIVGERGDAILKLKGELPGLFPAGATISEIQNKGHFDIDPDRLKEYLEQAGYNQASGLRIALAEKKMEMLEAAIPAGENFRLATTMAVTLLKAVAGQALGGVGIAIGMAAEWTISDPVRESLQSAGVWAYAQSVVEYEAVKESEEVKGHIVTNRRDTQNEVVGINKATLGRGKGSLNEIRQRMVDGTSPIRDYLTSLKSVTESNLQMQSRLREQKRMTAEAFRFTSQLGLIPFRASDPKLIERGIQRANEGTFFGGPNEPLKEKIREVSAAYAKAMEPVHFGDNPTFAKLAGMMLGRSYVLLGSWYLVAQREAELEAVAKVGDLRWSVYGGFYTSGQSGKSLSKTLAEGMEIRAGVTLSKTFDFSEALRIKEFSLQVDAANLNTQELTKNALRDLGLNLQSLDAALQRRATLEKIIVVTKKMVALDEWGKTVLHLHQPSQAEQNRKALDEAIADLAETKSNIHNFETKINKDIGKTGKDTGGFTSEFRARNFHRTLPFLRFEGYLDRTIEGETITDVLNKEGQDLLATTGKEIESVRALLAGMKQFVKAQSVSRRARVNC
jgi:hypothetical protein